MDTTNFPSCCNAKILHEFYDADWDMTPPTTTQIKAQLLSLKRRNNIVVAITADHQELDAKMKAAGFKKVGDAKRRNGHITLWAWLNPIPKKKKKATKRARR